VSQPSNSRQYREREKCGLIVDYQKVLRSIRIFGNSMQTLSASDRQQNLAGLANERFDVLVIGGGITGGGVALDAATRGYKVALVEKSDFASGTSSKSTKLVHGGIRYLPNFDFSLVHEALVERGLLLQNASFLVQPIGFVLPIYKGDRHPVGMPFTTPNGIGLNKMLDMGLWMYDRMAGRRNINHHRQLSRDEVLKIAPALVKQDLKDGFIYYDAQTNDARLTMTIIQTAARYGATIANYAEVTSLITENNQVTGVQIRDKIGEQDIIIRARYIVNATGVFVERIEALLGTESQIQVEPSKGVHLVLSRETLQLQDKAIVLPETEDKRILFIVPWESRAIFGTTDTGTGDLDRPEAAEEDINYLLKYLNRYLSVQLTENDIISTYAGYRPLIKPRKQNRSTARLSRTHAVLEDRSGLITIVGGKLTTYRRMAQDTVDVISRRDGHQKPIHPTENLPLQGCAGWPTAQRELEKRGTQLGLNADVIEHLGHSYGANALAVLDLIDKNPTLSERLIADLPYLKAEVIYACHNSMAMTPADILARRTSITLEDHQRGLGVLEEIATMMAEELNWSEAYKTITSRAYCDMIERQVLAEKISSKQTTTQ
jgi:glycerol-3-phosphate dehydrogenase